MEAGAGVVAGAGVRVAAVAGAGVVAAVVVIIVDRSLSKNSG